MSTDFTNRLMKSDDDTLWRAGKTIDDQADKIDALNREKHLLVGAVCAAIKKLGGFADYSYSASDLSDILAKSVETKLKQ